MTARPVVTMDEVGLFGGFPVHVDGLTVGRVYEAMQPIAVEFDLGPTLTATEIRAIADFLEQLEGANLLSGIREAGE